MGDFLNVVSELSVILGAEIVDLALGIVSVQFWQVFNDLRDLRSHSAITRIARDCWHLLRHPGDLSHDLHTGDHSQLLAIIAIQEFVSLQDLRAIFIRKVGNSACVVRKRDAVKSGRKTFPNSRILREIMNSIRNMLLWTCGRFKCACARLTVEP